MQENLTWNRNKQDTILAVDELLQKWEALENKKKLVDASLLELRKDVSLLTREISRTFR